MTFYNPKVGFGSELLIRIWIWQIFAPTAVSVFFFKFWTTGTVCWLVLVPFLAGPKYLKMFISSGEILESTIVLIELLFL